MAEENMNSGVGITAAENKLESSQAQRAADALESETAKMAEDCRDKAEQSWDETKRRVRTWQEDGEDYVRENPIKAVFAALGIGLVLGLMVRH